MNDLFKKLNVLVKSSLNDRLAGEERGERPRLGKSLEGDVNALRERVNEAVQYEDEIKARIRKFEDESARWDAQADDAVTRGDETSARYAIEQMRKARGRAEQAENDLREHERVTQDLIQRVNMLDAAAADVSRGEAAQTEAPSESSAPANAQQLPDLGGVLREAREKIASLADLAAAQRAQSTLSDDAPTPPAVAADTNATQADAEVDDDLDRRRARLSKR
jgi:hypothetical protein